jgi:N-acetylmuramoyl-L-alanine amidase
VAGAIANRRYHYPLRLLRGFTTGPLGLTLLSGVVAALLFAARPFSQGAAVYTLYTADGRRAIPYRVQGNVDTVSLEQLAALFNLTLTEDALVGGLTVQTRGQTILLTPGQSFASIGPGRVVSLPGPVQHDRNGWQVPVDFVRLALGPALNTPVDIRRPTHVIVMGGAHVPTVSGRLDRQGQTARLTIDVEPATPHHVTSDAGRLTVRFDATALDLSLFTGLTADVARAVHAEGPSLVVDLGPQAGSPRATDVDETHLAIDFTAPGATPAPLPAPAASAPRPQEAAPIVETGSPGSIRTVVIDPGHGGDDEGAHGPGGTKEKDLTLQIARRLKTTIEGRIGLRVLLTRDADENVPANQRTSMANNNKADLFISLHANASIRPELHGLEAISLDVATYKGRAAQASLQELLVPVATGGTRTIDVVPWDLAQIPFVHKSQTLANVLIRHLGERNVPLFATPTAEMALRPLAGANMPAVMIEMGFLTNATDEQALNGPERSGNIIDAIVVTIQDLRGGIAGAPAGGSGQ